jgi:hypothetical protein
MAKVAAKAAKPAAKKAASAKSKEKKSASGKPPVAAVPLPRARPGSSGASARVRAASDQQLLESYSEFLSRADHKARMEKRLFAADNETAMRAARRLGGGRRCNRASAHGAQRQGQQCQEAA